MVDNQPKEKLDQNSEETNSQENQKCCTEAQDFKTKLMYLNADFDNYRKRIDKEKKQWAQAGEDNVLKNVLNIVDDLERAFHQLESKPLPEDLQSQFQGFKLILKSAHGLFSKFHVEEVKTDMFDPEVHEALSQVESDKHKSGEIVQVYEKGYLHNGHLLRPAKVSVAK